MTIHQIHLRNLDLKEKENLMKIDIRLRIKKGKKAITMYIITLNFDFFTP